MKLPQNLLRLLFVSLLNLFVAGAGAQTTRIVVGGPPGGNTDIAARLVAEKIAALLKVPVIVDNKPGAGGTLAAEAVRNSRPDGQTIGLVTLSNSANETLQPNKSFSLINDLEPLGLYAWMANVLIVNPSIPARNIPELIAVLKARSKIDFSSGGVGSPGHLTGEMFARRAGLPMMHVPYKGAPPAVLAVVSNEVSLMFSTASAALPQIRGNTVRALAVTSTTRLKAMPDVPTLAEAGLESMDVRDWVGFVLPKGTPADTRERLHRAFAEAFADPQVRARLEENTMVGAQPALGPSAFGAFLATDVGKWAAVIKAANIRAE